MIVAHCSPAARKAFCTRSSVSARSPRATRSADLKDGRSLLDEQAGHLRRPPRPEFAGSLTTLQRARLVRAGPISIRIAGPPQPRGSITVPSFASLVTATKVFRRCHSASKRPTNPITSTPRPRSPFSTMPCGPAQQTTRPQGPGLPWYACHTSVCHRWRRMT